MNSSFSLMGQRIGGMARATAAYAWKSRTRSVVPMSWSRTESSAMTNLDGYAFTDSMSQSSEMYAWIGAAPHSTGHGAFSSASLIVRPFVRITRNFQNWMQGVRTRLSD